MHRSMAIFLAAACLLQAQAPAPPVANKFLNLFGQLRTPGSHVQFQFSDAEINEYMRYALRTTPRPGLDSVTVKLFSHNYVSSFSVIDFDAVERWKPGTIPTLLRPVLSGKKSVWVDYRFHTTPSGLSFSVEKAYYNDIRLPAFFVEKMISIVAARQPEKYDTSKPLPMPFGLKQVSTADHLIQGGN